MAHVNVIDGMIYRCIYSVNSIHQNRVGREKESSSLPPQVDLDQYSRPTIERPRRSKINTDGCKDDR